MSQMLEGVRSCWTLATEGNLPHGSELTKMEQLLQDPNSNSGDLLKAARDVAGCCKESLSEEVSRIQRKNTIDRPDNGWRKKIEDKLLAVQEKNRNLREELNFERKRRASVANSAPMAQTADLEGESAPLGKGSARPAGKGAGGPGHRRSRTAYSVSAPVFPKVEREDLKFQVKVRDKRIAELREEVEQIARTSATSTEITKLLSQVARQKKEIRDLKDAVHNQDDDNVSVATSGGLYLRWESLQSITEAFHAQHCRLLREAQRRTPSIPYYENYHRGLPFERVQILGDFITRYINDPCGPYEGPRREAPPSEHGTRSRKSVDTRGCGQQQDPKLYGGLIKAGRILNTTNGRMSDGRRANVELDEDMPHGVLADTVVDLAKENKGLVKETLTTLARKDDMFDSRLAEVHALFREAKQSLSRLQAPCEFEEEPLDYDLDLGDPSKSDRGLRVDGGILAQKDREIRKLREKLAVLLIAFEQHHHSYVKTLNRLSDDAGVENMIDDISRDLNKAIGNFWDYNEGMGFEVPEKDTLQVPKRFADYRTGTPSQRNVGNSSVMGSQMR